MTQAFEKTNNRNSIENLNQSKNTNSSKTKKGGANDEIFQLLQKLQAYDNKQEKNKSKPETELKIYKSDSANDSKAT